MIPLKNFTSLHFQNKLYDPITSIAINSRNGATK